VSILPASAWWERRGPGECQASLRHLVLATERLTATSDTRNSASTRPGLKAWQNAVAIRQDLARSKLAEAKRSDRHRTADVCAGGAGPTGVEMSSALALVLIRKHLRSEFARIDPPLARVVLIDHSPRVLGYFGGPLERRKNTWRTWAWKSSMDAASKRSTCKV